MPVMRVYRRGLPDETLKYQDVSSLECANLKLQIGLGGPAEFSLCDDLGRVIKIRDVDFCGYGMGYQEREI